jgi:hypothetical protein
VRRTWPWAATEAAVDLETGVEGAAAALRAALARIREADAI